MSFTWQGDEAKRRMRRGAIAALNDGADHVLVEAQNIAPIEEHTLELSGDYEVDESALRATIFFGGEAPAYAIKQHEDLTLRHDAGRQAKFLEQPLNEFRSQWPAYLQRELKGEL